MTFAERLCKALQLRNMTAAELSRAINVDEATLSNYKSGKYEPKQKRTDDIARALNVPIAWLMGADDVSIASGYEFNSKMHDPDNILEKYYSLDMEDRLEVRGIIKYMLKDKKYTVEKPYEIKRAARSGNPETDDTLTQKELELLKNGKRLSDDSSL